MVRCAAALRQHWRLHRARAVCVFSGDGGLVQPGGTRNRWRLGRLWSHLHCHREWPQHALRSSRSRAMELAPHFADGPFHRDLCWSSILALDTTCPRTRVPAWVGHVRPGAALAIFAAACAFGLLLLWALYSFRTAAFAAALRSATWLKASADDPSWHSVSSLFATFFLQNGIGLVLLLTVCVVTFAAWKRRGSSGRQHRSSSADC